MLTIFRQVLMVKPQIFTMNPADYRDGRTEKRRL